MALAAAQMQVRDLVMGPGTPFILERDVNPFVLTVRADQGGPRAWNHGAWSGAEWANERVVPIRVLVEAGDMAGLVAAIQQLSAAFAPVGDGAQQPELRFEVGGSEYLLFGRPRMVEPGQIGRFRSLVRLSFVAQDPRIYSGELHSVQLGLPEQIGGLTVPITVPFTVDGVLIGGTAPMVNAGTTDTALVMRVDGPVIDPTVTVQRPDGDVQRIRFDLPIGTGQWLDIDTASRTALLNGLPQANQRGRAVWDIDPYPLPPGASTVRFGAGDFNIVAQLSVSWRDAWW